MAALLAEHARQHAESVIARLGGPLHAGNLEQYLGDAHCMRWPLQIVFDDAPLEPHQFAQPVVAGPEHQRTCTLDIRTCYAAAPESLVNLVAYFAAVLNYGIAADPELCEEYGAALMGLSPDDFYARLCAIVDGPSDAA